MLKLIRFAFLYLIGTCSLHGADSSAPLADAIQRQDAIQMERLLGQQVDVNAAQSDGMTPLHWAVYHEKEKTARSLISAGANPNAVNRYGVTPLSLACTNGNAQLVDLLLSAGADANAALRGGESMLMLASRTGKLAPAQALIERGADVNAKERDGQSALMWAAAEGHAEVVDGLMRAGADRFATLESGFTPLLFAVRNGHTQVVLRLLESGVDVNSSVSKEKTSGKGLKPGTTPILLAVENGHFDLAKALLKRGADPNEMRRGYSPLHAITWVRKPLRGDGDPPPIGSGAATSLDFVRVLVDHGADVDARHGSHKPGGGALNKTNATPFLLASETGDVPLMKLLLELGADPTLVNEDHCTPLLAAAGVGILSNGDESAGTEEEAIEAVKLLLELGADINAIDDHGNSAIHGAVYENRFKLIEYLDQRGADISVWFRHNKRGWTPLDIAQGHRPGNFRLAPESIEVLERLLRKSGINPPPARPRS